MKQRLIYLIVLCLVMLYACKEKPVATHTQSLLLSFKAASEKLKENPDLQVRLNYWNTKLKNKQVKADSVLRSKVHYNIAGVFYGMNELDSLKYHLQKAWELMGNRKGYTDDQVQLYSGLGNLALMEQKIHQENYYYNTAAQMLLADTSINLTAKQKITVFFAAAQSSLQLRQFNNAFNFNRKAMALLPQLPTPIKEKFRAYSQMATCFYRANGSADSLYSYIEKMEQLYQQHPEQLNAKFICDRKVTYFSLINEPDSALFYNRKRLTLDLKDAIENSKNAESVLTGNLYSSYNDLAGIFINKKQLDSANFYLNKCQEFIKTYGNKVDDENLIMYDQNLANYYIASKKYPQALKQYDIVLARTKFVYELENARALAEMGAIVQLKAKDKSIYTLNQTVALSNAKLQSNRLWLAISTLGLLLTITIALLLYFIQKQRRLKSETERIQLEQRLLRTQIEPHFIFNTLSALQSFIRFNQNDKALKYLQQFGRLLRSSLQLSRESYVKLSEEIETLQNYLSLQQMRYDDAFDYQINIDQAHDAESVMVPPMLMQPFVENAIIHGINPNGKEGMININFDIKDEILLVTIADNGKGFAKEIAIKNHKSLATAISKERLAILAKQSGETASIEIQSEENKGTTVSIILPIKAV
ncbi:sensor histidine kinase [Pedobacter sp. SL55]|uniref:sensor histidine kinase n=1 Tax=Pedobacter sp. SL55 TaxID=2995161 RepID=UPI0022707407|nr:histidine kinase [Pedobacter sp. SL55]WAC42603.1 histidine kinase [Pedobacter sp. SL55]